MKRRLTNLIDRMSASLNAVDGDLQVSEEGKPYVDFKQSRELFYKKDLRNVMDELRSLRLEGQGSDEEVASELASLIKQLHQDYQENRRVLMIDVVARMKDVISRMKETELFRIQLPSLPDEVAGEIHADAREIERCFSSGSYRSVTILCGRILEVALHRKYYEATGQDILETQPGIGLGKLIAKLKEKQVSFDPGLTEQIHLINQVRVSSVHKKAEVFHPSKEQAHAMVLYTVDVLGKLF
ncbi:MAG: hypothetical protein GXP63_03565 [DPANN group archaeon]|nr:hypothetical protein [DPANN group archaeon]